MPMQDRTGPRGQGPLTGRGFGPCGQGIGFGRGCRRFDLPQVRLSEDEQKKILKVELDEIEAEKIAIEKELKKLKA